MILNYLKDKLAKEEKYSRLNNKKLVGKFLKLKTAERDLWLEASFWKPSSWEYVGLKELVKILNLRTRPL